MIILIILAIVIVYLIQIMGACYYNIKTGVRFSKTIWEFIKMTNLPYMLFNYKKYLNN